MDLAGKIIIGVVAVALIAFLIAAAFIFVEVETDFTRAKEICELEDISSCSIINVECHLECKEFGMELLRSKRDTMFKESECWCKSGNETRRIW